MGEAAFTAVPLTQLRKAIATRMTEAKQTIPHFRVVTDIEMDALLAAREQLNATTPPTRVSVTDCIVKACAAALMKHPTVNSQLVGDTLHQFHQADISVVVAVAGGLSAPIVRAADRKTVYEIAAEVSALAARAARGQLRMTEILGGSFSISNLGSHGVEQFDAIINPPQCAILAVGRAAPRVVVTQDREVRIATMMRATLSIDHRAIDGAVAAEFLATLRELLQQPGELFGA